MTKETAVATVEERARLALRGDDKGLMELVSKSKQVVKVEEQSERDEAHNFLMTLVKTRTSIRDIGKAAREDAQKFAKAVIAEEDRLVEIIEPEEKRLKGMRDVWDEKIAAEKAGLARAEERRLEALMQRMQDLEPNLIYGMNASELQARLEILEAKVIDESFQELQDKAMVIWLNSKGAVKQALEMARHVEAQDAEIERLSKIAAEAAAKDAAEKAALAEVARKAQEEIAASRAREEGRQQAIVEAAAAAKHKEEEDALKARKAAEREAKRLGAMPDRDRLNLYAASIKSVPVMTLDTIEAKEILKYAKDVLECLSVEVVRRAAKLVEL